MSVDDLLVNSMPLSNYFAESYDSYSSFASSVFARSQGSLFLLHPHTLQSRSTLKTSIKASFVNQRPQLCAQKSRAKMPFCTWCPVKKNISFFCKAMLRRRILFMTSCIVFDITIIAANCSHNATFKICKNGKKRQKGTRLILPSRAELDQKNRLLNS